MADVTSNRDRGQLILVTGLLVAVAMVALVLLLNTAIYTENLASRGTDQSGREAVEYRATVVEGVGGLIEAENDREHVDWNSVNNSVVDGIDRIDNYTARSYAIGGTVVRIDRSWTSVSPAEGTLVRQTDLGTFQNESRTLNNWTVATGVNDARDVRLTVDPGQLQPTEGDQARANGAFYVNLTGGGQEWQAFIYRNSTSNEVAVATATGGNPSEVCSVDSPEVTVDLTRGTIGGESCPELRWAEGIPNTYDIAFWNGNEAEGTYNLTINGTSVSTTNLRDGTSDPNAAYYVPAVYSVTFDVSYETPTLTYRSEVRVAPGEPR